MTDRENGANAANDMADAHAQPTSTPDPSGDFMPDNPKEGDHWNDLASVLGAEVREEPPLPESHGPQPEDETAASPKPLSSTPPEKPNKPRRPSAPANWDALATSLGVELPQQPVIEQPESGLESQPDEQAPEPAMSTEQLAETVENLSEFSRSAPASLGHEPTVVIVEETVTVFADPGEVDAEESDEDSRSEEPARGRPKHRRRLRSRADQRQAAPADSDAEAVADVEPEDDDAAGEAEAEETLRSKRRRPRRRRQKSSVSEAKAGARSEAESDELDTADGLDSDDRQESSDEETGGGKMGHRSIPAWQEAIGIIVEKNLESRSTKPAEGQSPKRGGRRSGRRGRG